MSDQLTNEELIEEIERDAGLSEGLLIALVGLEASYPNLNARGVRQDLFRDVAQLVDEAADRTEAAA